MTVFRLLGAFGLGIFSISICASAFAENRLTVGMGTALYGEITNVPLELTTDTEIQGFVMVAEWDEEKGQGIAVVPAEGPGDVLEGADLITTRIDDDFLVFSAVMDLDGQGAVVIPPGDDQRLGTAQLRCICPLEEGSHESALVLVDGRHAVVEGGPLLDNVIVVDGRSVGKDEGLVLEHGTLVCGVPSDGPAVACGGPPDAQGNIVPASGLNGETVSVCYYYRIPPNGLGDHSDEIQGFSLSVSYDCNLECDEDSIDITGSVLEQVGAEFLDAHCDNDATDGDACELIVGMLIDAAPPFDGRTLPPTDAYGLLFCMDYTISESAECGKCLPVEFVDGLNGRGDVPTRNLASINFFEEPFQSTACQVCVVGTDVDFLRGDCNFNEVVNVADPAAIVGFLFLEGDRNFQPPCVNACDADDDEDVTVTDVIFVLNYLFIPGEPAPPAPGPNTPGPDPTPGGLSCAAGQPSCP